MLGQLYHCLQHRDLFDETNAYPTQLAAAARRVKGLRRLWGVDRGKKGAASTLAALKSIRAVRPDGAPIDVILDNLSAHKGTDIRRWAKRNKVKLCFTPTYPSWANPIEAHFGPLRQLTVERSSDRAIGHRAIERERECGVSGAGGRMGRPCPKRSGSGSSVNR